MTSNIVRTIDGKPDDISIYGDLFRMEQMDKDCWWLAVYQGDKRISIFLNSKKRITATIAEDDPDCEYIEQGQP